MSPSEIAGHKPRPYFQRQLQKRNQYSGFLVFLFLLLAAYTVIPIIDVPLMGLSLSAPIFAVIALRALFRPPRPWLKQHRGWITLALLIWLGVFTSGVGNGLRSGGEKIDTEGWLNIVRYAYWLLVFVVTAHLASLPGMLRRVSGVLGWAVFGLGLARLFEAFVWGNAGPGTSQLLTQNGYGFLFSSFFPFLFAPVVEARRAARLAMILRLLLTAFAVLLNGSRSSWITLSLALLAFAILYFMVKPKKVGWSVAVVLLSASAMLLMQLAPDQVTAAFDERLGTFSQLEQDKSFVIRQLMVQKGWKLFQESPLIGVGISRFTKETTALEIPRLLGYASQSHFDHKSAHNSYIAFLAETGLAGMLPYGCLLAILGLGGLKSCLRLTKQKQVYALGVYTGFLGMSVHMWSISSLTNTSTWLIYGLVAALIKVATHAGEKA